MDLHEEEDCTFVSSYEKHYSRSWMVQIYDEERSLFNTKQHVESYFKKSNNVNCQFSAMFVKRRFHKLTNEQSKKKYREDIFKKLICTDINCFYRLYLHFGSAVRQRFVLSHVKQAFNGLDRNVRMCKAEISRLIKDKSHDALQQRERIATFIKDNIMYGTMANGNSFWDYLYIEEDEGPECITKELFSFGHEKESKSKRGLTTKKRKRSAKSAIKAARKIAKKAKTHALKQAKRAQDRVQQIFDDEDESRRREIERHNAYYRSIAHRYE